MTAVERMVLLMMSMQDLEEAVQAYEKAIEMNGAATAGYTVPLYYGKESIKRRIVKMRQDLLMLENSL